VASKFNPIWRMIARNLSGLCQKCGKPRLYSVFDAFVNDRGPNCSSCWIAYESSLPLIKVIFDKMGLKKDDLKQLMQDKLVRRSMLNVVRGISHFGLRNPQPTAVPVVIVWNYTNKCNLGCLHCHQNSGHGIQRELTIQEKFRVIDRLADAGVSILTFSGGEPLICSDLFESIKRASDSGLLCTIASNGVLMTKENVTKIKAAGIKRVEIGLDGATAETHNFLRNTPGAFEATIHGIKNCAEADFDELCATMTLHSKNVGELRETISLAEGLGVTRFYLNRLIPAGRGKEVIHLDITKEQKLDALEFAYSKFYESATSGEGIQCYCRGMTYYGRLGYERSNGKIFTVSEALSGYSKMWNSFGDDVAEIVRKFTPGFGGCSAGITYAGLTASGQLLPCVPAPIELGNLLTDDLEEVWVNNKLLQYIRRRDKLSGACGKCAYNFVCGGCRYTAYAINGDWLAADPSCPYGPCSTQ